MNTIFQPIKGFSVELHFDKDLLSETISNQGARWIKSASLALLNFVQILLRLAIASLLKLQARVRTFLAPVVQRWAERYGSAKVQFNARLMDYLDDVAPLQLSAVQEPRHLLVGRDDPADAHISEVVEHPIPFEEMEGEVDSPNDAGLSLRLSYLLSLDRPSLVQLAKGKISGYFRLSDEQLATALFEWEQAES